MTRNIGRNKEIGHKTIHIFGEADQSAFVMPALWLSIGVKLKGRRRLAIKELMARPPCRLLVLLRDQVVIESVGIDLAANNYGRAHTANFKSADDKQRPADLCYVALNLNSIPARSSGHVRAMRAAREAAQIFLTLSTVSAGIAMVKLRDHGGLKHTHRFYISRRGHQFSHCVCDLGYCRGRI
jgi:hypothetical protein